MRLSVRWSSSAARLVLAPVGDPAHRRIGAVLALGAVLDRPEQRAERQMGPVVELLIAKQQERVSLEGLPDGGVALGRRQPTQIDLVHLDPEAGMQLRDAQEVLHRLAEAARKLAANA